LFSEWILNANEYEFREYLTMPHTHTKTVYYFNELSDRAKERARDWYRAGNDFAWAADSVIEDVAHMADLLGIDLRQRTVKLMGGGTRQEPEIYYSGFSTQGDGACFVGSYAYKKGSVKAIAKEAPAGEGKDFAGNNELNRIAKALQEVQRQHGYRITADVKHTGTYYHAYSTDITVYQGEDYADTDVQETIVELLRDFMQWIYRQLEQEWEYRNSDAVVDEEIEANEYEFTEDGRPAV
jgi:hypothetical protein